MNRIRIQNDKDCCGCRACENICPKKAITMQENKEGFCLRQEPSFCILSRCEKRV